MNKPIDLQATVGGRYKLMVHNADGELVRETPWFDNLITNVGMDRIGQGTCIDFCRVGTGNATPANTDSALGTQVGFTNSVSTSSGNQGSAPYYGWYRRTFTFAQGAAAGNLNEVGVGWASSGATLFSRALISPTVTVLVTEFLTVVYELRMYPPLSDVTGSATIGGTSRSYVIRASDVTSAWSPSVQNSGGAAMYYNISSYTPNAYASTATLGAITGAPTGGAVADFSSVSDAAYTPGNYYRDGTISASISAANATGGIACIQFVHSIGTYQMSFSPVLEKDNTKTLDLTFRLTWARH